ncbi:XamI family restriction endonuclease [Dyella sp.]|uniref:XamI family restriction endonuclease n=1 Tax=Dyella sp. TaxID=1869338 RepID=UPI002D809301|nr:XamI family restriction endonuclease [Dyella sp.]
MKAAMALFREQRLGEPLALWKATFRTRRNMTRQVFNELDLRNPRRVHSRQVVALYEKQLDEVLRYLTAPPVSHDDLKVLSDSTLSVKSLRANPYQARSVLRTLLQTLDPFRFPWVEARRRPSPAEWKAAIMATAALMTAQRVATTRRNTSKDDQESAVKEYLRTVLELSEEAPRDIHTLRDAPATGSFCGESKVAGRKADIVVSLFDGRLLLIECKVSNSALNSVKRLNNDAGSKAAKWVEQLGASQVVPAAMLSGVFKVRNLMQAQDQHLALFWAHRLEDLGTFINAAR